MIEEKINILRSRQTAINIAINELKKDCRNEISRPDIASQVLQMEREASWLIGQASDVIYDLQDVIDSEIEFTAALQQSFEDVKNTIDSMIPKINGPLPLSAASHDTFFPDAAAAELSQHALLGELEAEPRGLGYGQSPKMD